MPYQPICPDATIYSTPKKAKRALEETLRLLNIEYCRYVIAYNEERDGFTPMVESTNNPAVQMNLVLICQAGVAVF